MTMHEQDIPSDLANYGWETSTLNTNTTREEEYYYMNVDHHLPANMELERSFISNYDEYLNVLRSCNSSIHRTPYPRDGKFLYTCRSFSNRNTHSCERLHGIKV